MKICVILKATFILQVAAQLYEWKPHDQSMSCVDRWINRKPELLSRFSRAQLSWLCERIEDWQNYSHFSANDQLTQKQTAWLNQLQTSKAISCLEKFTEAKCNGTDCASPDALIPDGFASKPYSDTKHTKPQSLQPKIKPRPRKSDLVTSVTMHPTSRSSVITTEKKYTENSQDSDCRLIRKEYRQLKNRERIRFQQVLNRLKKEMIDSISKYDLLITSHSPQQSPGAHWGPAFLPFHRELLKQLEIALRQIDPEVSLPYWDSTLDEGLPDPTHSIIWTELFFGNGDGHVTNGPFANWHTTNNLSAPANTTRLFREVGSSLLGSLYKETDWEFAITRMKYSELTACLDPTFEMMHSLVNMFVGGSMADAAHSPNDPIFFMHQCFTDLMWETFRQIQQTSEEQETEYPPNDKACSQYHYGLSQMRPFSLKNKEGLSKNYTRDLYYYYPRPTCSDQVPSCASTYLYCDIIEHRCLSKIREGGNCTGFEGTDICFMGICNKDGICELTEQFSVNTTLSTTHTKQENTERNSNAHTSTATLQVMTSAPTSVPPPIAYTPSSTTVLITSASTTSKLPTTASILPINAITNRPPISTTPTMTPYIPTPTSSTKNHIKPGLSLITMGTNRKNTTLSMATSQIQSNRGVIEVTGAPFPVVWFTVTIIRGSIYFRTPVPGATVKTIGLNVPTGYTQSLAGKPLQKSTYPEYEAGVLVQVMDPDKAGYFALVKASVEVLDEAGNPCQAYCYMASTKRYVECDNQIKISSNQYHADPIEFRKTENAALRALWKEDGYRTLRIPDYLMFKC